MQNDALSVACAQKTAEQFGVPYFDLSSYDPSHCPSEILHHEIFQQGIGLPLYATDTTLFIATIDPSIPALSEIAFLTGKQPYFLIVDADKLQLLTTKIKQQQLLHTLDSAEETVRYINKLLCDAINKRASDIHFESYEQYYRIRFRIDGLLIDVAECPQQFANNITARLKIMANLDIAEKRLPQDGRIKLPISTEHTIDCRVSTCPTLQGEKIVLRMLETDWQRFNLANLGMDTTQIAAFSQALQQSQGLILVTGPTGSGKTVSLYTGLCQLNTIEKNISTVEDPVEIQISGINQVPINLKTGLNFATALRALLRQDPDVIMVGEIRDLATAEIAVNASQTGHLVLSTLHTNSACESLVRFANMGVPAYNIASAISLIVAQRLVRKLCQACKHEQQLPPAILIQAGFNPDEIADLKLYAPGKSHCHHCTNGYAGRIGIYEVMPISATQIDLILANSSANAIENQAVTEGMRTLRMAALDKVREGVTSLSEINRVIS